MYGLKRVLAVTFARAGSKGVPGKNLRLLQGKPLIAHSIEAGVASRYIDRLIMTTDGAEIARVAQAYGAEVPFLRPKDLARDDSPALPALKHAVQWVVEEEGEDAYDAVVILEPTTPMRTPEMVDEAIALFFDENADAVLGVAPVKESPYWMFTIDDQRLRPLLDFSGDVTLRQALPSVYGASGIVFINRTEHFLDEDAPDNVPLWELGEKVVPFVVNDPLASIDLDTEVDFAILETLLEHRIRIGAA